MASGKTAPSRWSRSACSISDFGLRIPEDHGQREEKEDDPARDLERAEPEAHRLDQDLAAGEKGQEHHRGDRHGADREPGMQPARHILGNVEEDGQRPHRVDDHEENDEILDEGLPVEHGGLSRNLILTYATPDRRAISK